MFERFTEAARETVIQAQTEAQELGHSSIGTEHVLLGVLWNADGAARDVADSSGLGYRAIREQIEAGHDTGDAEALSRLGIDLDEVRRRVEAEFGEGALSRGRAGRRGHLPFGKDAKKTLELSLREAISLKHNYIGVEHILLALTRTDDTSAAELINRSGANPRQVHDQLRSRLQDAA